MRILPRSEYHKLQGHWPMFGSVPQESVNVAVVEEGERIVGSWALIVLAHAEGIWVDPSHRSKGVVLRKLWRMFKRMAGHMGIDTVITGSDSDLVTRMLERQNAQLLPPQYLLSLGREV